MPSPARPNSLTHTVFSDCSREQEDLVLAVSYGDHLHCVLGDCVGVRALLNEPSFENLQRVANGLALLPDAAQVSLLLLHIVVRLRLRMIPEMPKVGCIRNTQQKIDLELGFCWIKRLVMYNVQFSFSSFGSTRFNALVQSKL